MRFPDFGDIGTDSVIVGDIHVAIAAQVAVPVEFIAAKELASGQVADRGGREAQGCEVEAHVSRTKTLFNETVKGNPHVGDEGSRECPHPIHCGGPIQALERLLASLARAAENTIVVAIFGAAVLSVASKDAVLLANDFIDPGDVVIELVFCEVARYGKVWKGCSGRRPNWGSWYSA